MSSHTISQSGLDCGMDHTPTLGCTQTHVVGVVYHRSSDMVTIGVDSQELIMTDRLFLKLREMMNAVTE